MKSRAVPVLLLCLAVAGARAQEQPADARQPAPPAGTGPDAPAVADEPAPRTTPDQGRFEPSEEISEDLSVSFPADI